MLGPSLASDKTIAPPLKRSLRPVGCVPDVETALRLLDTVSDVDDLSVDTRPLQEFAAEVNEHVSWVPKAQRGDDRLYM
jgi:predicted ATP-grasp superfamily ATP-dependent carboligase